MINHRIKVIYSMLGFTQKEFADKIGVSQQYISSLLNGNRGSSYNFVKKIKSTFPQVNTSWILEGTGKMFDSKDQDDNKELRELYSDLHRVQLRNVTSPPYEYEVITYDNLDQGAQQNYINEKAIEGWELVTASYMVDTDGTKCFRFFFRRKLG